VVAIVKTFLLTKGCSKANEFGWSNITSLIDYAAIGKNSRVRILKQIFLLRYRL